jgi:hypothetical protein
VFRRDNRLVLTYLPEGPAADEDAVEADESETDEAAA